MNGRSPAPDVDGDDGEAARPKYLPHVPETLRQDRVPELIPVRMLNELAFCTRLFAIEWMDGLWRHNAHTIEGAMRHERIDEKRTPRVEVVAIPGVDGETTSLALSSERFGLTAKLDRVVVDGSQATPIEHKKGRAPRELVPIPGDLVDHAPDLREPDDEEDESQAGAQTGEPRPFEADDDEGSEPWGLGPAARAWWPDQVQVGAQAILLEEAGFQVPHAFVYYAAERRRVRVPITKALRDAVIGLATRARALASTPSLPPPLVSSAKCGGCSLQPICLPDEVGAVDGRAASDVEAEPLRRILAARDDEIPLYVMTQGARVRKVGESLRVERGSECLEEMPLRLTRQVCLFGNVQITTQAVAALAAAEIPLVYLTRGGKFVAITSGMPLFNVMLRKAQFERLADPDVLLRVARGIVTAKIFNQRALLMRNGQRVAAEVTDGMKRAALATERAESLDEIRGHEGAAAASYFGAFENMLRREDSGAASFDFATRNRRPPRDPINAMLSFGYALLAKDLTATCLAVGLDPLLGALHSPAFRRPALALDLMEEWRPLIVDSAVVTLVNNRMVGRGDFWIAGGACEMKEAARRIFLEMYEKRLQTLVTHPIFGYRIAYRRAMEVQVRLFGRLLAGEIEKYPGFRTR